MPFTLDILTFVGQVRYLIGDKDSTAPIYTDAEITGFGTMAGNSLYLACALALDGIAATAAQNLTDLQLGTLKIDETSKVEALRTQADRFRDLDNNTPAFAVIEENLCSFNELQIIRNFILRTEV